MKKKMLCVLLSLLCAACVLSACSRQMSIEKMIGQAPENAYKITIENGNGATKSYTEPEDIDAIAGVLRSANFKKTDRDGVPEVSRYKITLFLENTGEVLIELGRSLHAQSGYKKAREGYYALDDPDAANEAMHQIFYDLKI